MNLPTPYTVGVKKHSAGATDAHGNASDVWADPIPVAVYSIAPATSTEPFEAGRTAVVTGLTVLAPWVADIHHDDIVIVDGVDYTVEGVIADWNHGPFEWTPGIEIRLERVEG